MRRLSPASASIAIHTDPKMIVEPKSGCSMRNTATKAVSPPDIQNTGSALSFSLSDSSHAIATTKKGLRNSDGWSWPTPSSSQRTAPFFSAPMNGTTASRTRKISAPPSAKRRARSRGIIEMMTMTGSDAAIHMIWR